MNVMQGSSHTVPPRPRLARMLVWSLAAGLCASTAFAVSLPPVDSGAPVPAASVATIQDDPSRGGSAALLPALPAEASLPRATHPRALVQRAMVDRSVADLAPHRHPDARNSPVATRPTGSLPVDDLTFVALVTTLGREERRVAEAAVARLQNPDLRRLAELLATHQAEADQRLTRLVQAKGWPVPRVTPSAPALSPATPIDYDAQWTAAMIAERERALALYRGQSQGGGDVDLREYARITLPTIEHHLEWLRRMKQ